MTTSDTTHALDAAALVENAKGLIPLLRERAPESEELRRIPDDVITAMREAGLFTAMRPLEAGGSAIGFGTFVDITRILSQGDASAGWVGAFLMSHEWLLSRFGQEAQAEIFADGPGLAAAAAAPPGRAVPVDGGYQLTGRWRFASAVMHANWVVISAMSPSGPRSFVVPRDELILHDVWHVPGMRGTGSNDVEAQALFVPEYRSLGIQTFAGTTSPGSELYPSYGLLRYPMYRVLAIIHGAVAVGTAEAALELFPQVNAGRIRPTTRELVLEEPETQSAYGKATEDAYTARLLLDDAVRRTVALYDPPAGPAPLEERAILNLASAGSGVAAFDAVDSLIQVSGASIHRSGHVFDRICRNTQVMRNHTALDWRHSQRVAGRVLLGQGLGADPDEAY